MSPLSTLIGLLWASTTLWPPSAIVLLLAARTLVILARLPHPREHQEVIPDVHTLRTLLGVARPELVAYPDLAFALDRLVGECEEVSWYSPPILDSRALLAQWREAQDGYALDREAS